MTTVLHVLVVAFCLVECGLAAKNPQGNAPKILMLGGLGVIHGLVPALTPREMMWPGASDDSIRLAALLSLFGVMCFAVGWRVYERGRPEWRGLSPGLQLWASSPRGQ